MAKQKLENQKEIVEPVKEQVEMEGYYKDVKKYLNTSAYYQLYTEKKVAQEIKIEEPVKGDNPYLTKITPELEQIEDSQEMPLSQELEDNDVVREEYGLKTKTAKDKFLELKQNQLAFGITMGFTFLCIFAAIVIAAIIFSRLKINYSLSFIFTALKDGVSIATLMKYLPYMFLLAFTLSACALSIISVQSLAYKNKNKSYNLMAIVTLIYAFGYVITSHPSIFNDFGTGFLSILRDYKSIIVIIFPILALIVVSVIFDLKKEKN